MENKSSANDAISQFFQDTEKVTQALQAGIRAALLQHKQAGNPIYGWKNGKIIRIEPDKIPLG